MGTDIQHPLKSDLKIEYIHFSLNHNLI